MTPLQHASYKGNQQMVDYLICHGADVNSNGHDSGYTALMFAALSGTHTRIRSLWEGNVFSHICLSVCSREWSQVDKFQQVHVMH